jgi:hypothetical protein
MGNVRAFSIYPLFLPLPNCFHPKQGQGRLARLGPPPQGAAETRARPYANAEAAKAAALPAAAAEG